MSVKTRAEKPRPDDDLPDPMIAESIVARFSDDRVYRYLWEKRFYPHIHRKLHICMLNPSTADEFKADPTVTRCLGFAARNGFGMLWVTNLFAYRSTDPKQLLEVEDPVGPKNDAYIRRAARYCDETWVAWGANVSHPKLREREEYVLQLLWQELPAIYCIDTTVGGHPRHPLYLRSDAKVIPFTVGEP